MSTNGEDAPTDLPARNWLNTSISLIQPLSLIMGGCWVVFLYFTYQERSDSADLQSRQLSIQQAQIVLQTQEQSNKLDLELKKMALDQARVALEVQQNERQLKETELAADVELKRQEVALNELKQQQQQHDVEYSVNHQSSYELNATAERVKELSKDLSEYRVHLHFTLKNVSTVNYEVSYVAVERYVGILKENPDTSVGDVMLTSTGAPPSLVNSELNTGGYQWTRLGRPFASVWRPAKEDLGQWRFLINSDVSSNVDVGVVAPGETTEFEDGYIVRAKPGTHLAFVVDWIINRGKDPNDVNARFTSIDLPLNKTAESTGPDK